MKRILTSYNLCFAIALFLFLAGQVLLGIGFTLGGLILRLESRIRRQDSRDAEGNGRAASQQAAEGRRSEGQEPLRNKESLTEGEPFVLEMAEPWMEKDSGWDTIRVYPSRHQYVRQHCLGGPPTHEEAWEYELKGRMGRMVFHRLLDRREDDIYPGWYSQYEVVNGCIQEEAIERGNEGSKEASTELIAQYKREIVWHQLHGALKYFIVSKHCSWDDFEPEHQRLQKAFAQVAVEAGKLGATRDEYGGYRLPGGADEARKQELRGLLSPRTLLEKYDIRPQDLAEQDKVLTVLNDIATAVKKKGAATT